jgi:lipoyl(octanoyl) transferase
MPISAPLQVESQSPALEAFLLGQIGFDTALALQQRLVAQCRERDDGQIMLLLCEHPAIITIGRSGSAGDIAMQNTLIRNGQIEVRWVNRGGGCIVHCPGQLAIYPIVPLCWHGFSVGEFLYRFHTGLVQAIGDLNIKPRPVVAPIPVADHGATDGRGFMDADHGATDGRGFMDILSRTGRLAAIGVAVRHWVTYYGAYLNVSPPTGLLRLIKSNASNETDMSSLAAERCGPVRMTGVRAAVVRRLAESFGCDRYHLYTGHPMLRRKTPDD